MLLHTSHLGNARRAAVLIVGLGLSAGAIAAPLELHVAPAGQDVWSGTLPIPNETGTDGPLATPQGALEHIRAIKEDLQDRFEGVTVIVHGGVYPISEPLRFDPTNGGGPASPVTFRAAKGDQVSLQGGFRITTWQPYRDGIFQADLNALGAPGTLKSKLLYCNGERLNWARYPNAVAGAPICGGWAFVDGDPIAMYSETDGDKVTLTLRPDDSRGTWSNPAEGELFVFPRYNWWNNVLPIRSVDWEKRVLTTASPASFQMRPGDRYFVQGLREELDAPGEWYLDREARVVYFKPRPDTVLTDAEIIMPQVESLVDVNGTGHIVIEGFTLEYAEMWGVRARSSQAVEIRRCVIRHLGSSCAWDSAAINLQGYDNRAVGNDIYDVGAKGINLLGGDRTTLKPGNNVAENNYIHHTGVVAKNGFAIRIDGVGNRIANNTVHDIPREGLSWNGNDNLIELNHVRHTNTEISDTAIINACNSSWVKRGTVIRWNYLHDPVGFGKNEKHEWVSPFYCWAIYLDNWTCGTLVHGNICVRAPLGLCHNHGGRDNRIENNITIDGIGYQFSWQSWEPWSTEQADGIVKELDTYAGTAPYAKYPGLVPMLTMTREERYSMSNTRLERNIFSYTPAAPALSVMNLPFDKTVSNHNLFHPAGGPLTVRHRDWKPEESWQAWRDAGFEKDSLIADPLFVDAAHDDYRLRPESPAWELGFERIPVERIGCYDSPDRASWPIVEAEGVREHPLKTELMPKPPEIIFTRPSFRPPRRKADAEITIDGDIDTDWPTHVDFRHGITVQALVAGGTSAWPTYSYIVYDDEALYVCMRNLTDPDIPLKTEARWNANDAVEIALRTPQGSSKAPIFLLRGFPNGEFIADTEAGAPADGTAVLQASTRYAAKVLGPQQWCAEWRIPFRALGLESNRGVSFDINLTCRKTAHDEWVMWNATHAVSWMVSRGGTLQLE